MLGAMIKLTMEVATQDGSVTYKKAILPSSIISDDAINKMSNIDELKELKFLLLAANKTIKKNHL